MVLKQSIIIVKNVKGNHSNTDDSNNGDNDNHKNDNSNIDYHNNNNIYNNSEMRLILSIIIGMIIIMITKY